MPRETHDPRSRPTVRPERSQHDETFKRHGPEPPENDSGPSQDGDELFRNTETTVRNDTPDQQVD